MRLNLSIVLVLVAQVSATILHVPAEFATIQEALNSSAAGDTVLAAAGTYNESTDVPPHHITLAGPFLFSLDTLDIQQCILRPSGGGRCVVAGGDEQAPLLRVIGMTLRGGVAESGPTRGGIFAERRDVEIRSCRIDSSYASSGGALYADACSVSLTDCRIVTTGASENGMACFLRDCQTTLTRTELGEQFSAPWDWDENMFYVERGRIELRTCVIHGTGWNPETLPGSHGIRQADVVDEIAVTHCTIRNNRFQWFFDLPGEPAEPHSLSPSFVRFDSNHVYQNEVQMDFFRTDLVDQGSTAQFRGNVFEENSRIDAMWVSRMFFTVFDDHCQTEIAYNLFLNNGSMENSVADFGATDSTATRFHHNYCLNNSCNGFINGPGGVIMMVYCNPGVVEHNIIAGSQGFAAFQGSWFAPPYSYAYHNYWGDSTGPLEHEENPGGLGDSVETSVQVTPWESDTSFLRTNEHYTLPTPIDFLIGFAYPNPFNSEVTIEYVVTGDKAIQLEIVDLLGREVATVESGRKQTGIHRATWQANDRASGIYFARLTAEGSAQRPWIQKLVLLK